MIAETVESLINEINDRLHALIPLRDHPSHSLFAGARYTLSASGKRIRPLLVTAVAEMLGSHKEKAFSAALAVEMIHTYSMIHDDLPCMDNDDFRRGRPTLHKLLTEGESLLVGNYLFTEAFSLISQDRLITDEQKTKLVSVLAKASSKMMEGQAMDLKADRKWCTLPLLQEIHEKKTGALLCASCECGAIVASVEKKVKEQLTAFGEKLGLLFQIVDDLLDVTASEEKHGKKIGSDEKNDKATYVTFLGLEKSKSIARELVATIYSSLNELSYDTFLLKVVVDKVASRID